MLLATRSTARTRCIGLERRDSCRCHQKRRRVRSSLHSRRSRQQFNSAFNYHRRITCRRGGMVLGRCCFLIFLISLARRPAVYGAFPSCVKSCVFIVLLCFCCRRKTVVYLYTASESMVRGRRYVVRNEVCVSGLRGGVSVIRMQYELVYM